MTLPLWLLNIGGILKKVPREVWYGIAALAAWWFFSSHYINQGREQVLDELRAKQIEAQEKAEAARNIADEKGEERAQEFEAQQETLKEVIRDAETNDTNALDGIFAGGVR